MKIVPVYRDEAGNRLRAVKEAPTPAWLLRGRMAPPHLRFQPDSERATIKAGRIAQPPRDEQLQQRRQHRRKQEQQAERDDQERIYQAMLRIRRDQAASVAPPPITVTVLQAIVELDRESVSKCLRSLALQCNRSPRVRNVSPGKWTLI